MLNFAKQTGSGAVIVVWSFLSGWGPLSYITSCTWHIPSKSAPSTALLTFIQSNNLTSYACKTHTTAHLVSPMDDFCHHCLINPPKKGQLFTAITQVSLNLHQFILFLHAWQAIKSQTSQKAIQKQQNKLLSWKNGGIPWGSPWCIIKKSFQKRPIILSCNPNTSTSQHLNTSHYSSIHTVFICITSNQV